MCESFSSGSSAASGAMACLVPMRASSRQASAFSLSGALDCRTAISFFSCSAPVGWGDWAKEAAQESASAAASIRRMGWMECIGCMSWGRFNWLDDPWRPHRAGAEAVGIGVVDKLLFDGVVFQVALEPHADVGGVDGGHGAVHHFRVGHGEAAGFN